MAHDIRTILWKEWKSMLRYQGRRSQVILSLLTPMLMAIYMPWEMGRDWLDKVIAIFISAIIAMLLVSILAPDSFAGERERHTLPTLLVSRLPDRAILLGKLGAVVAVGWAGALGVLLVSLVTVNIVHGKGEFLIYSPTVGLGSALVSLLMAILTAAAGVLISLRATTVQQAQQTLVSILLFPPMLLGMVPFLLMNVLPNGRDVIRQVLGVDLSQVVLVLISILIVLTGGLLALARARFRRARLVLT